MCTLHPVFTIFTVILLHSVNACRYYSLKKQGTPPEATNIIVARVWVHSPIAVGLSLAYSPELMTRHSIFPLSMQRLTSGKFVPATSKFQICNKVKLILRISLTTYTGLAIIYPFSI